MRRFLTLVFAAALATSWAGVALAANVDGNSFNLDTNGEETDVYQCSAGETLRVTATAVSGQALSSGDSLLLQFVDRDDNDATLATWTSSDMPVDKSHACTGRNFEYKVELTDADSSSDVNVEIWVDK